MSRNRFRAVVSMTLAATFGWSALGGLAQDAPPGNPAAQSAAETPPSGQGGQEAKASPTSVHAADEPEEDVKVEGRPVETIRERGPRGNVRTVRQVAQDAEGNYFNHGTWQKLDDDGNLISVGEYREGLRHGHWEQVITPDTTPLLRHAPYREFSAPFVSEADFEHGKLHGKWIISDARERKVSEVLLKEGVRHGTATWYYPNGGLYQEIHYVDGQLEGDLTHWSVQGAVVSRKTFREGRHVAVRSEIYDNGQVRSQVSLLSPTLVTDALDDWSRTEFVKCGVRGELVRQGRTVWFHSNGQKAMEGVFLADQPIGKHVWWNFNGRKLIEGTFHEGKPDGQWTWWHDGGSKATQGDYLDGMPIGEWVWWDADGKVVQRAAAENLIAPTRVAQPHQQVGPQLRTAEGLPRDRSSTESSRRR